MLTGSADLAGDAFALVSTLDRREGRPYALDLLLNSKYDISALRSKSWDEFAVPGAPGMDFVFTVCDDAANEVCPVWPGQPMMAHWGVPDPSRAEGTEVEKRLAFADAYKMLRRRIELFTCLPIQSIDRMALKKNLDDIGRTARAHEEG